MSDNEENKEKTGLIELESLIDLVHLIVHTPFQVVNHIALLGQHLYFIVVGGFPGFARLIYLFRQQTPIQEKFIVYNNLQDTISFGNQLETRGGISFLPIINIKNQNILTVEDFTF